jgi:hypothetical protein
MFSLFLPWRKLPLTQVAAVRKNRYVILPVDFEEAWKVSMVVLGISLACEKKGR